MDIAVYCNGLSSRSPRFCVSSATSVCGIWNLTVFQARSNLVSKTKEHKCSIWYEKQYFENLIRNVLLRVFNPRCTIVGMQHLMPNSISAFLQIRSCPRRLHYCSLSVCCGLFWHQPICLLYCRESKLPSQILTPLDSFLHAETTGHTLAHWPLHRCLNVWSGMFWRSPSLWALSR